MLTIQIDLSVAATLLELQKLLEYKAETLPAHTFRYVDYKYLINGI